MVTRRTDYTQEAVAAARSVLLEITHLLGEYQEDIIVVGGWVPELLLPQSYARHVGSIDVDLALNHLTLQEAGYKTIAALLLENGYGAGKQPFIFHRIVQVSGHEYIVEVDFLAGEYGGTGKRHRTQKVQICSHVKPEELTWLSKIRLKYIAEKFSSPVALGPTFVADFEEVIDSNDREILQRDVFERIQSLLKGLGIRD